MSFTQIVEHFSESSAKLVYRIDIVAKRVLSTKRINQQLLCEPKLPLELKVELVRHDLEASKLLSDLPFYAKAVLVQPTIVTIVETHNRGHPSSCQHVSVAPLTAPGPMDLS